MLYRYMCCLGLALALCGCGGGGIWTPPKTTSSASSASSTPSTSAMTQSIEGVYQGTTSTGKTLNALVLEDGSWWSIYGIQPSNALSVQGIANGTSSASSGNFNIVFADFPAPGASPISGTGSGLCTSTNLLGTIVENGVASTFNVTVPLATNYDYNAAANLAPLTGTWSGGLLDGEAAVVNVVASGSFTATSSLGCSATGTLTPRPSGKNVFNSTITFGGSPCVLAGQTASGIALAYPLANGATQIVAGFVTAGNSRATAFFAAR